MFEKTKFFDGMNFVQIARSLVTIALRLFFVNSELRDSDAN